MGRTLKFKSNIAFIAWLKQKGYTKSSLTGIYTRGGTRIGSATGIYTSGGTRVGSVYERKSKGKKIWEVILY